MLAIDAAFEALAAIALTSFLIHNRLERVVVVTPAGTVLTRLPAIVAAFGTVFEQLEIGAGTALDRLADSVRPYFYCVEAICRICRQHSRTGVGRCLYVDADTLCLRSLEELTILPLGDQFPLAACSHGRPMPDRQLLLGLESPFHYFNAGVLLFDPQALAKILTTDRVVAYYESHRALCRFREQCALNALLKGRVQYLPSQFNYLSWMRLRSSTGRWHQLAVNSMAYCLEDVRERLAIAHLSAGATPCQVKSEKHEAIDCYWLYLASLIEVPCQGWSAASLPTFHEYCMLGDC